MIDIHTHNGLDEPKVTKHFNYILKNQEEGYDFDADLVHYKRCSVGMHPWFIDEGQVSRSLFMLRKLAMNNNVTMIGECGLDKIKGPDYSIQEEVFIKQIRIGEELRKPVIIHSVKSLNEMLAIKKVIKPKVNMLIHGFKNKKDAAIQLISHGFYLSFGEGLLKYEHVQETLKNIDLNKVFFETDDADININKVYQKASEILGLEVTELTEITNNNYIEFSV